MSNAPSVILFPLPPVTEVQSNWNVPTIFLVVVLKVVKVTLPLDVATHWTLPLVLAYNIDSVALAGYVPAAKASVWLMVMVVVAAMPIIAKLVSTAVAVTVVAVKAVPSILQDKLLVPLVLQAGQEPPQSTPVSVPFCMPSVQVGVVLHWLGQGPPQSTPSSPPSCTPLVQLTALAHASQGPPQSIPVSPWFCLPSSQLKSCLQELITKSDVKTNKQKSRRFFFMDNIDLIFQ